MFDLRRPLPPPLFQRSEAGLVHVPIEPRKEAFGVKKNLRPAGVC